MSPTHVVYGYHAMITFTTFEGGCLRSYVIFLPLVVSNRQWWDWGGHPGEIVILLHHAVAQRDKVALQDDQALAQSLCRQRALGHLSRQLLLVINEDHQTVPQLMFIYKHNTYTQWAMKMLSFKSISSHKYHNFWGYR